MVSQAFRFSGHNTAHYDMWDYDFDNMTISEFCAITDFFPSSDEWLWELERIQVTSAIKQLDRNRWVYCSDLKRIIDNYQEDYQKFKEELPKINQSLVSTFANLKARIFDASNLSQFLESITFQRDGEVSTVSSPLRNGSLCSDSKRMISLGWWQNTLTFLLKTKTSSWNTSMKPNLYA